MIILPGLWVIVRQRHAIGFMVGKVIRVAGSLVYVHMDQDRRVGKSRVVMSGDEKSMRYACDRLNSAAGELTADIARARRVFNDLVDVIVNPP